MRWNDDFQKVFDIIKQYLLNLPVLKPTMLGKPLMLYLAMEHSSVGAIMAHEDEYGIEHAVYYLSKKFLPI